MKHINLDQARFNMVEQQIRTWEVLDAKVLDAIRDMPRHEFVPERYRNLAYADIAIPLAHGEQMLHPKYEAKLLQALDIQPSDVILEVGAGSGYLAALLAKLGKHVYSVDIHPDLLADAGRKLQAQGVGNVTLEEGDASAGWDDHAPYDAIALTGSLPALPESLKRSLKIGGRLFAIVGRMPVMEAVLVKRVGEGEWLEQSLFETVAPALEHEPEPQRFVF